MSSSKLAAFFERSSPYAGQIIQCLRPHASIRQAAEGEILATGEGERALCYLVLRGRVAIYRAYDDKLLVVTEGPSLFGISTLTPVIVDCYCKTLTSCELGILTSDAAMALIGRDNLWEVLSHHLMFVANRLYTYLMQLTAPTAYELVRLQLMQLMAESDEFRSTVVAEKYIRDKTFLSRSGVMRILGDLRTGGYIEMKDGKLLKINKLPEKY